MGVAQGPQWSQISSSEKFVDMATDLERKIAMAEFLLSNRGRIKGSAKANIPYCSGSRFVYMDTDLKVIGARQKRLITARMSSA